MLKELKYLKDLGGKPLEEAIASFLKPPEESLADRLAGLIAEAEECDPGIIAENIGSTLRELLTTHSKMPRVQYIRLVTDIITGILNSINHTELVWSDKYVYLKGLKEVWITCEPPLDLVKNNSEDGAFKLLKKQMESAERILYFQYSDEYFKSLVTMLQEDSEWWEDKRDKIGLVKLPERYPLPLAIYRLSGLNVALSGRTHPQIINSNGNGYKLTRELPGSWMQYLPSDSTSYHINCLNEYLNGEVPHA